MAKIAGYQPRVVGLAWVREEDYQALLLIFTDADKMPATWKEWLKHAEEMEKATQAEGHMTERVYIDPDTVPEGCARNDTSVDRQGRHKFVAMAMAEKYRTQS